MASSAVAANCIDIQFRVFIGTNFEAFVLYLDLLLKLYMCELISDYLAGCALPLSLQCCCLME
jgi:hypothetical protein